ncbi:hypothetical protein EYZ11_012861 [Aspergillus tanneri]|uniref:Uncharacterized protein n=1 Tax=Aspergillus tanneri TaxID=1220188 RepID=A0A4S3IZE6_9EURO|nr:hypothetical protein EYZ11_012861 [Aspergillus tanneri]
MRPCDATGTPPVYQPPGLRLHLLLAEHVWRVYQMRKTPAALLTVLEGLEEQAIFTTGSLLAS